MQAIKLDSGKTKKGDQLPFTPNNPGTDKIPEEIMRKCTKIVLKAKLELMSHRFFGSMALTMPWVAHPGIQSYATDSISIYYNPYVVLKEKSVQWCAASFCHEVCHKIFRHNLRMPKGADPLIWNYACDYAINPILVDEGVRVDREGNETRIWDFIKNPDVKEWVYEAKYHGWYAEQIYEDLIKKGFQPPPMPIDIFAPSKKDPNGNQRPLSEEEKEQLEIALKSQLINAAESHKAFGLKSGSLKDLIKGLKKSYVDWRQILQRKVIGDHPEDYTWRRPNRRFIHQDIYMPSVEKRGVGRIIVWPDSSGSMTIDEMESVASEIKYIMQTIMPDELVIVQCDAAIHGFKTFVKGELPEAFDFKGRGGTNPSPFFKYCNEQSNVHCAICLTDMGFNYHTLPTPSGYPVIFISTSGVTEAPFGTLITIPVKREN